MVVEILELLFRLDTDTLGSRFRVVVPLSFTDLLLCSGRFLQVQVSRAA